MREGWGLKTLGELCEIARGGSPRPIENYLTDRVDGVNWIKIGDATASTKYIYQTREKIRPEGVARSRLVKDGDFLLSNSMSFGRPYIMRTTGCIHDGWLVLSDKSGLFDQDYLYHFLGSAAAYRQFDNLAAGSTVRNLNTELVRRVSVPLPPLLEQQRIVAILDEVFAGLATATTNAEKNLASARELFESTLNASMANTKTVPLSALATDITDGDHLPPPKAAQGLPFITISNIDKRSHQIDLEDTFRVPETYFRSLKSSRTPRLGDVLYTVTGSFGIPAMVETEAAFCFQRHIALVRPNQQASTKWLYYAMRSRQVFDQANTGATGTAQKTVSLSLLRQIRVPYVEPAIQTVVTSRLDQMRGHCEYLEKQYETARNLAATLKQSILAKAFSGELTSAKVTV